MLIGAVMAVTPILFSFCFFKKKYTLESSFIVPANDLEKGFQNPPDSIQTGVYWYWVSNNISKQGVIKDLEAMKKAGINRAFIANIALDDMIWGKGTPYGKVKLFSDEWWDVLHTALKTATRLGIEIGIFNSPGWSQSGGPWVKPAQAMRYLASTELTVKGPVSINQKLSVPAANFQDVKVIAFPAPEGYNDNIRNVLVGFMATPSISNIRKLIDGTDTTGIYFPANVPVALNYETIRPYTARSLVLYPAHQQMNFEGDLQVFEDNGYRTIKHFHVDRSYDALTVGFKPYGPEAVSIPATTSKKFRVMFYAAPKVGLIKLVLSSAPVVGNYIEKSLAKMFQKPLPYWNEYQWEPQPAVEGKNYIIDPEKVRDISQYMSTNGTLNWQVPVGTWIIMRSGMVPTYVTNSPASVEGTGLEVDKMSQQHVAAHFNAFLGEIIRRIPAADRKCWKVVVQDSYETGSENWTDGIAERFKARYGYNPLPFIPVLEGRVVGSEDLSDRFLWDLRRFVADNVASEYVGGLKKISHEQGLTTWLENYGHWGFPGEFLQYGGQSDEVSGEFWSEGELGNIENRAASSCAHIYGKNKVSAESFTCAGDAFSRYPAMMKQRGDRFFAEGINNTLLHVYIEQPYDDKVPGVNAWFSNEFNRLNTWFCDMDMFTRYLKRCNFMLRQGNYVADVAYFIGEDAPKMTGVRDPEIPQGYSYDYINGDILRDSASVIDGRIVLKSGMTYKILVLPKLQTMRPELLRKIKLLVEQGAVVYGPAPQNSPSLQNYTVADQQVKEMAAELWGNIDENIFKSHWGDAQYRLAIQYKPIIYTHKYGKGLVMDGMSLLDALNLLNVSPDCKFADSDSALFIHRHSNSEDIYFITNQTHKSVLLNPVFRIRDKVPELWDAVTGTIRYLPSYTRDGEGTYLPITLAADQSAFIVFRKSGKRGAFPQMELNFPKPKVINIIQGPWQVTFDAKRWGPPKPVIFNELADWSHSTDASIKYYSGTALYHNTCRIGKIGKDQHVFIDLGAVKDMARVTVNNISVGGVWTPPYEVDITGALHAGENTFDIEIVNTWVNRLIGDQALPPSERKTWVSVNPYNAGSPLQPSGLIGPVTIKTVQYGD